jgi:hypothetical protein
MNRTTRLVDGCLALVLLAACGGYDIEAPDPEDAAPPEAQAEERLLGIDADGTLRYGTEPGFVDVTPAAGELGQTQQRIVFGAAGATQPGSRPDTYETCVLGNTIQNCLIFSKAGNAGMSGSKKLRYWIIGGNAGEKAALVTAINAFYTNAVALGAITTGATGFKVEAGTSLNDPALTAVFDLVPGGGFCTASNGKVRNNMCWTGQTQQLADGGMPGTYQQVLGVPVAHFDIGEIDGRAGLTAAQRINLKNQAYGAAFAVFYNIGLVVSGDNRCNTVDEQPNGTCVWRQQQSCFINATGEFGDLSGLWVNTNVSCGT